MPKLRVLLADDHPVVREGLKTLIDAQPDMEVTAEAGDGRAALRLAREVAPDVAVLDMSMPELNGALAARQLRRDQPHVKVLALSVHEDKSYLHQFLEAGASGYVVKRAATEELVRAIRTVAAGGVYLDPRVAGALVDRLVPRPARREAGGRESLTDRETEVLRLIARGHSNKQVAARLDLSVKTVETHKKRAMDKLGLSGRVALLRHAVQYDWLQDL